jgi:hypothetical protein
LKYCLIGSARTGILVTAKKSRPRFTFSVKRSREADWILFSGTCRYPTEIRLN